MPSAYPAEPTFEQIEQHACITWVDQQGIDHTGFACWYPQMDGYIGKCVVEDTGIGGCFEAYVWHNGEFPFGGEDYPERPPVHLHHCCAKQFVEFGNLVASRIKEVEPEPSVMASGTVLKLDGTVIKDLNILP